MPEILPPMPEVDKILDTFHVVANLADQGRCPDCHSKKFWRGPSGGCSEMLTCAVCGSRFNYCGPLSERSNPPR